MSTTTPNYGLVQPTNGADAGAWGSEINGDLSTIDTDLKQVATDAVQNGGGQFQVGEGSTPLEIGMDQAGYALRVSRNGSDLGYVLRTGFGAGGPASGGFVTISTGSPSGTPNDGDLWLQYS